MKLIGIHDVDYVGSKESVPGELPKLIFWKSNEI